jgi:hypothetical protein
VFVIVRLLQRFAEQIKLPVQVVNRVDDLLALILAAPFRPLGEFRKLVGNDRSQILQLGYKFIMSHEPLQLIPRSATYA